MIADIIHRKLNNSFTNSLPDSPEESSGRSAYFSSLSSAQQLTKIVYNAKDSIGVLAAEILGRLSSLLLSPAAAIDFSVHAFLMLPTFLYAIGKSIYVSKADFTLPWQHLQRVRNSIAPIFFGSALGLLHPAAGLIASEPTDKYGVLGMLSSNAVPLETPCSPIHSLSIVEDLAVSHQNEGGQQIFSPEHIRAIEHAKEVEHSLEILQAQEWVHKITNVTLLTMGAISQGIRDSNFSDLSKEILERVAGLLIPALLIADIAMAVFVQAVFLMSGMVRLLSGRGLMYTEITVNPWMHVSFLVQYVLKAVGFLIGAPLWFIHPMTGFKASLYPGNLFFKAQMELFMQGIKSKLHSLGEGERMMLPITYGTGASLALAAPHHNMHTTYLIVEKKNVSFNLYWVNRPDVTQKRDKKEEEALSEIRSMFDVRFPFMDIEKVLKYPVYSEPPPFLGEANPQIARQGNSSNCVVSNLFGSLEVLDRLQGKSLVVTAARYSAARKALMRDYDFYKKDFFFFAPSYNLSPVWSQLEAAPYAPI